MPYDSNGNFSLVNGYLAVTGQAILASQHNPPLEDIASGLSSVMLRSGVASMSANLPMGGFKVTGLGAGVASTDAVTVGQASALVSSSISAGATKAVPIDADSLPLVDSAAGNSLKRITWAVLKAFFQPASAVLTAIAASGTAVAGDILYATGAGTWGRRAKGTDGQILQLASGLPTWADNNVHIGEGQTWIDVTGIRVVGAAYQNNTTRPIMVAITGDRCRFSVSSNNTTYVGDFRTIGDGSGGTASIILPVGWYVKLNSTSGLINWSELR